MRKFSEQHPEATLLVNMGLAALAGILVWRLLVATGANPPLPAALGLLFVLLSRGVKQRTALILAPSLAAAVWAASAIYGSRVGWIALAATYSPLVAVRAPVVVARLRGLLARASRRRARERAVVVEQVTADLHQLTGWDLDHLRQQVREDTCTRHGKFCCEECFAI